MNYLKSRISLILAIVMIAMVAFPFVTLASSDSANVSMSVKINGTGSELVDMGRYKVKNGDTIEIRATSNVDAGVYKIGYYYQDAGSTVLTDTVDIMNSNTANKTQSISIKLPNNQAGQTKYLFVDAVLSNDDGTQNSPNKTQWQTYILTWEDEETKVEDDVVNVKYGNKVLDIESTTFVEVNDKIVINAEPANKVAKIFYRWDKGEILNAPSASKTLVIPENFDDGELHILDVVARYDDGHDTVNQRYFFKINRFDPEDDELEILPWEKESKDLDALAVSLRNDPESEKANKNVYALGEKVTYFVDYKNGGKDIKAPVELKLELPLEFDLISADGGKVDNAKRTITWNFPNGLENEAAGTKVVEIEYVKFDKKSTDSETVYPLATISKDNKVADESAVINFIYRDEDTVIEDLHTPYMFGDKDRPTFRPDDSISRAEGALVLTRILLGQNAINNVKIASEYPDLGETYLEAQKAIVAATKYGIINGYTDGYYRPNTKMTRAEFMKILAKYIEINAEDEGIDGLEIKSVENRITLYKNVVKRYVVGNTTVSEHWAIEEVSLLERLNMTSVDGKNKDLRLDEEITRAEVAQLVNFFLLRAPAETNSKTKSGFEDVSKKHELFADIIEATREAHEFTITLDGTEIAE